MLQIICKLCCYSYGTNYGAKLIHYITKAVDVKIYIFYTSKQIQFFLILIFVGKKELLIIVLQQWVNIS